ncbi:uncharacterized protein TRIVIDRAFT_69106 [Trichoderma virens Gv29-8]|uniref:S-adenosyl-L-methionine-dependent methyltransferase n=1 Tax=Hypocrea virens (strain Gv29-8 / FGSC 10586) TaxID=413071 RepID=G9MYG0_HYPVG|nr:uncharacterized protein TRIVIDRAFT_69106 [Trichoderma virens Gv29-8]EHK20582.1 hypothetical protein TRIVIDRAFT_69106 [Trichoderma virens Gv29-8]UKZ53041.1 hypothetical protein TrVGV298_006828 [Trichoderma virens]
MQTPNADGPSRLVAHFSNRNRESQADGWTLLWESDQSDLWDRGKPSPALIDFVESQHQVLPRPAHGRPLRALVPGCGRGYDVVMLALHGYEAYGLEVSAKAVDQAEAYAASELAEPSDYNFHDAKALSSASLGSVTFVRGDFFQRNWEAECAGDGVVGFDLIYDYTFLCALLPEMRQHWGRRMRELLNPSGMLVCLEFPLYKALDAPGPPWGLQGVYWDILAENGSGIISGAINATQKHENKGYFIRTAYIKPPRSYEQGRGTDMLSIWALK